MSKEEIDQIVDIRFNIKHDNPFRISKDLTRTQVLTSNFYDQITKNPDKFKSVNWIEDSRINRINRYDNGKTFGQPVETKLSNNRKLCTLTANCLDKIGSKLEKGLITDLKTWVDKYKNQVITLSQPSISNTLPDIQPSQIDRPTQTSPPIQITQPVMEFTMPEFNESDDLVYKNTEDITTYDLTQGKQISFEDLCRLTCSIARSQLTDFVKKDENILFMEEREKDRIRKNIEKYLENATIATMYPNLDVNSLSLKQLQYYSTHIEDYYETLKLMDFMKSGLNVVDLGYTKLFPNGIPMPGGRYKLKLDGAAQSVKKVLFDRESPVKIAFKNIQEKYNLHISDELLVCVNIGTAIWSKLDFEKVETDEVEESESSSSE